MRAFFRLVTTMAIALVGSEAHAQDRPRVRLVYTADAPVACPDESAVRKLVGARLGYDPFASEGERIVTLRIAKRGASTLIGRVEIRGGTSVPGTRELSSPSGDCEELVSSLAVTIAVGIDPLSITGPQASTASTPNDPAAPSGPTLEEKVALEDRPPPAPPKPAKPLPRLRAHAGPIVSVGATPTVGLGLTLGAGARWQAFSLGAEGRLDLPVASKEATGGEISASLLLGTVAPCFHAGIARGCVLATGGALRASGEGVSAPKQTTRPWAAVGARAGIEVPLSETVALGAHADLYGTLTRITLRLDDRDVWTSPPLSGAGGFDVLGAF